MICSDSLKVRKVVQLLKSKNEKEPIKVPLDQLTVPVTPSHAVKNQNKKPLRVELKFGQA